eukprot:COSAG04_NODE_632_length_11728_cov_15.952532_1_plen_102_part_10
MKVFIEKADCGASPTLLADTGPRGAMAPFALTKFFVYETVARVYIVGTDNHQQRFRLLKIDRSGAPEDFTSSSDGMEYDAVEFQALLQALHDGNPDGGCQLV